MFTKKELEQKVRDRVESVMNSSTYREEFEHLSNKLNISTNNIADAVVAYDVHADEAGNELYESHAMRAAMRTLYLAEDTYHKSRERAVVDYLNQSDVKTVCEIGFGVPTAWVFELVLAGKVKATLIDIDPSAKEFSETLLSYYDPENKRAEYLDYKIMNMDNLHYPGDFDAYIMMDSLEHTKDPTSYLNMLVSKSPSNARFIISIPIGEISDFTKHFHYMEWKTEQDATKWLTGAGLEVMEQRDAIPNPDIDFFIHSVATPFYNLLVLCEKSH